MGAARQGKRQISTAGEASVHALTTTLSPGRIAIASPRARHGLAHKNNNGVEYYPAFATMDAFENLYNVSGGTTSTSAAWAEMWRTVASRFQGQPEILGLELINEPFTKTRRLGYRGRTRATPMPPASSLPTIASTRQCARSTTRY